MPCDSVHYRKIILCQAPWKRHSAKTTLCQAPPQTLGKDLFAECQTQAVSKEPLCRAPRTRQSSSPPNTDGRRLLYREPSVWHSAKAGSLPSASWPRQSLLCRVSVVALGKEFLFILFFELSFFVMLYVTI